MIKNITYKLRSKIHNDGYFNVSKIKKIEDLFVAQSTFFTLLNYKPTCIRNNILRNSKSSKVAV